MTTNEFCMARADRAALFASRRSTAYGTNVAYGLGKLKSLGLLKGVWLDGGCADEQSRIDQVRARKHTGLERGDGPEYYAALTTSRCPTR